MPWIIKNDISWLIQHAFRDQHRQWICKKTKAFIQMTHIGRSIWVRPMEGGFGEVRQVQHFICPVCSKKIPEDGTEIYEDELMEMPSGDITIENE